MKESINPIKVKWQGKTIIIDLQKELSINENIINSQLKECPSSYYILCSLRDKYIKTRDELEREKDIAYSKAWTYYKESNERWSNDYVAHKANVNKSYVSAYEAWQKAYDKAQMFITICKAYESRTDILRTLNANLRRQ